jgi:hypothetical protein
MVYRFIDEGNFYFGFLIGLGDFFVGFSFMLLFFQNTYGKEVITIIETTVK